jgi:hypothetical protein
MLLKPRLLQPLAGRFTNGRVGSWRASARRGPDAPSGETRAATPRPRYWARISSPPLPLELTRRLSVSTTTNTMTATIDSETLKQYLADSPPTVVPLAIKPHFDALSDKEKLYAHHLSV